MKIIGFIVSVAITLVVVSPSLHAHRHPVILSATQGKSWVEQCIEHHPEILWLADAQVRKTQEGQASLQCSYSEQLFGQKFIEFDRTLMTLHCLRLILEGSDRAYRVFTEAQSEEQCLSREGFQQLHHQGRALLRSRWGGLSELQMAHAMETALVLGDMGKSEQARALFVPFGINSPDHDDFHGKALQLLSMQPQLSPSFSRLPKAAQRLLGKVANVAHYGHITHLEGGPSMYEGLRASGIASNDPVALSFDLFVHTCDVAGALGHVNNSSSLVYTEPAHRAMQAVGDSVRLLSDTSKTSADAYHAYLSVRASWLGLNAQEGTDRVLARIGAMLRLWTPEEGVVLQRAMASLSLNDREKIIAELDIQQAEQLLRTPTYMPAVLVNLLNNSKLGSSKEQRLSGAIELGLPFICRALAMHKERISQHQADPAIPLNFNKMAGIAKTAPELLAQQFTIDAEGNVQL